MAMRTKSFESRLERPPGSTAFQVVAVVKVKKLQHKLHTYCCSNGVVAVVVVVVVVVVLLLMLLLLFLVLACAEPTSI